jgi:hypothetical protein
LVVQDDLDTQIPADSFAWDVILSTIQVLWGEAPEAFFQSFHADE